MRHRSHANGGDSFFLRFLSVHTAICPCRHFQIKCIKNVNVVQLKKYTCNFRIYATGHHYCQMRSKNIFGTKNVICQKKKPKEKIAIQILQTLAVYVPVKKLIHSVLTTCTVVGLSLGRVTCETSQVLLADGQVVFLRDLTFSPHLTIDSAQNE